MVIPLLSGKSERVIERTELFLASKASLAKLG